MRSVQRSTQHDRDGRLPGMTPELARAVLVTGGVAVFVLAKDWLVDRIRHRR